MSEQTYYFKRFDRLPGRELKWDELVFKEYIKLKKILKEEFENVQKVCRKENE